MTRKPFAFVGTIIFLIIAPGFVAGLVPYWLSRWRVQAPFFDFSVFRSAGVVLFALSLLVLPDSFARFVFQGLGTPAPVFPTRHLVVTGLYRYVRNPIYIAVVGLIFGQALFFGNVPLLEYGVFVWIAFHVWVLIYEEPILRATFADEYKAFCAAVPRWIPRLAAWHASTP